MPMPGTENGASAPSLLALTSASTPDLAGFPRLIGVEEKKMVDAARAARMADRIKEIVARRLERGIKDPRLGFVTITDVRVTGDLQHASIFYTVYGADEERADSAAALKSATGMLRSEVGKNIT